MFFDVFYVSVQNTVIKCFHTAFVFDFPHVTHFTINESLYISLSTFTPQPTLLYDTLYTNLQQLYCHPETVEKNGQKNYISDDIPTLLRMLTLFLAVCRSTAFFCA